MCEKKTIEGILREYILLNFGVSCSVVSNTPECKDLQNALSEIQALIDGCETYNIATHPLLIGKSFIDKAELKKKMEGKEK